MRRYLISFWKGTKLSNLAAVAAVWCGCLLYVLFQGGKTSMMLFSMVSLLSIYLIGSSFGGVSRVKAVRTVSADKEKENTFRAGEQVRIKLDVMVPGLLPMPYLVVREVLQRHNGDSWSFEDSVVPSLRGAGKLIFKTPPLERGRYSFAQTECASEDIFGLMEHRGSTEIRTEFRVLPRTVYIPNWQRSVRSLRLGGTQTTLSSSRRETTQINGVRDYVYGDRISRIHWNATAKTGSWKSKEFEHESLPKTMVVLDCRAEGYQSSRHFELAVSAAASLVEYGAREHEGTGLFTAEDSDLVFAPSNIMADRMRMIQHLVDVDAGKDINLLASLEKAYRHFPKGALFMMVSPLVDEALMETFRWAENRGLNPCLLRIQGGEERRAGAEDFSMLLRTRGLPVYTASSLEELPGVLGGAAG